MLDNNIIQSLGAGSGIDTTSLVRQLTDIERAGPQSRIDTKRESTETKISDFGLISSALATLEDATELLVDPEGLFSKSAAFTESDALVPTNLSTDVLPGVYNFVVNEIASAQALAFSAFSDPTDAVGEGTLTFNFGAWTRDGSDNPLAFTQDTETESQTITVTSENNSLEGLRDTINDADFGVQASIVFDGTDYRLSILAESGNSKQIEIVASEAGGAPTNSDASDLSRFAFNDSVASYQSVETQKGQDAELTVNGLSVSRSSNAVDDIVEGLSLDILKAAPTETITVTITDDKTFAEQNIRGFVDSYNAFLEAIEPAFGSREEQNEDGETETIVGSLTNDALAKSIVSQIRNVIAGSIPGLANSDLTSLTNIGIRTELDGTISISEDEFTEAFADRFEDVQKLFAPQTVSSSTDITVNSFGSNTVAGEYDVVVSTPPTRGSYAGGDIDNVEVTFPFDTTGKDYTFKVSVNGTESGTLTIPTDTYASDSEFAAAIQSVINADTTIKEANQKVTVSYNSDSDSFDITSTRYGSASSVNLLEASADSAADLGLAVGNGTTGVTVAGTINGKAGFGSANVLLPALGEDGEGLALVIGEGATSSTVNFSRGFAGELGQLIEEFLDSSGGLITERETNLRTTLEGLDDDQSDLDRRIESFEERLIQQYIAMERIISSLNSSGSFLENLIDTLPFTSDN